MAGRCCPAFIWDSTIKYPADVGQSRYAESVEGLQIWDGLGCYERSGPSKFGLKGWGKDGIFRQTCIREFRLWRHICYFMWEITGLPKEKDQPYGWSDFSIHQLPNSDANT